MNYPKEVCPECFRAPECWIETSKYGSRQVYWIGCKEHSHLAGGVNQGAALMNWNRLINRWKFEHQTRKAETWLG